MRDILLLLDAHVHIYPFMSVEDVLDSAWRNFRRFESEQERTVAVMFVADPNGVHGYQRLIDYCEESEGAGHASWKSTAADARSVCLSHSSGFELIAVKGQQLITSEGLEVLGIGHDRCLASGLSARRTIEQIRSSRGLSGVAWGAGKWLGRRGRVVSELAVAEQGKEDFVFIDNGGRPRVWRHVPQFITAKERSVPVLAGTDPLPLQGEESRIGSYCYGLCVSPVNGESIFDTFLRMLASSTAAGRIFGEQMRALDFLSAQIKLRLR